MTKKEYSLFENEEDEKIATLVRDLLFDYLDDLGMSEHKSNIVSGLLSYCEKFGFSGFRGWIEFCKILDIDNHVVCNTLLHDLAGQHDRCFVPHTNGYSNYKK